MFCLFRYRYARRIKFVKGWKFETIFSVQNASDKTSPLTPPARRLAGLFAHILNVIVMVLIAGDCTTTPAPWRDTSTFVVTLQFIYENIFHAMLDFYSNWRSHLNFNEPWAMISQDRNHSARVLKRYIFLRYFGQKACENQRQSCTYVRSSIPKLSPPLPPSPQLELFFPGSWVRMRFRLELPQLESKLFVFTLL